MILLFLQWFFQHWRRKKNCTAQNGHISFVRCCIITSSVKPREVLLERSVKLRYAGFTALFLLRGVAPHPTRCSASGLRQRINKPFGIPRAASPLFIDTLLNNIRKSFRMLYLSWVFFILFSNPCYRIKTIPVTAWPAVNFSAFFFAHFFIGNEFFHIIQHLP